MPSSQAAATERRNSDSSTVPHEPPKLKTTLKTPPKQATNPLQFVKVGPCSLYRTAQEQLQKVQEVKKVKPEVRDDPEDWQSNLDNWKSSRRKRQEHIIERVVEVKKLELEEHDRQRRRSKTFSEMMEERGNRGRKLSISLAVYNEEDANDLSDLGIGTSSGKSSVSGDTHDDSHSLLSDRDSEIDKNHSDVDNAHHENGADANDAVAPIGPTAPVDSRSSSSLATATTTSTTTTATSASKCGAPSPPSAPKALELSNGFHKAESNGQHRKADSSDCPTTTTEPEEYTYEGAIRGYVSRVAQSIPRRSLAELDAKLATSKPGCPEQEAKPTAAPVKVDILKRREMFEKASLEGGAGRPEPPPPPPPSGKSIKERLSILERQKRGESEEAASEGASSRERKELLRPRDVVADELEGALPLRERLSNLEKLAASEIASSAGPVAQPSRAQQPRDEFSAKTIKERLVSPDAARSKPQADQRGVSNSLLETQPQQHQQQQANGTRAECNSTPSERSSSPDSEYRSPRGATFHQSLDSLDADASSGPDTFERVQSLEELDYQHQARRYPASSSSAELLNDTDREDSGIHTADASCSVSQADEPIADEESAPDKQHRQQQSIVEETTEFRGAIETTTQLMGALACATSPDSATRSRAEDADESAGSGAPPPEPQPRQAVPTETSELEESPAQQLREEQQRSEKMEKEATLVEEEEEEEEAVVASEQQQQSQTAIVATSKPASSQPSTVQPGPMSPYGMGDDETQREPPPPVRPTSLALERTTLCPDFLSPLSPVSKPILPLSFSSDEEIVAGLSFPLGPPTSVEPPKEKPPPPPVDLSDEENHPIEPLKRLNSTRRIKKELRTRRSDFLGIEGFNDDELERELTLSKPPDMAAILAEERRIEQLHRRSYDTDSNYEQDSSHERDSGVELGQAEDWAKQTVSPDMSQHSRQSSEPFGASVTSSEEDELNKKERDEHWRYDDERDINGDIGEKLAYKLRELEEEKMELERKCAAQNLNDDQQQQQQQPQQQRRWVQEPTTETLRMNEENLRKQEELTRQQDEAKQKQLEIQRAEEKRQEELRMQEQLRIQQERDLRNAEVRRQEELQSRAAEKIQENNAVSPAPSSNSDEYASRQEVLRVERELLQLEQEELKRQRTNLSYREHKQQQLAEQLQEQWKALQQEVAAPVSRQSQPTSHYAKAQPIQPQPPIVNYRSSMPNLPMQLELVPPPPTSLAQKRRPPPPPIPPAKPLRLVEQRQRDVSIRNSRIPSADSIPQQVEAPLRPSRSATMLSPQQQHQQQQHQQQHTQQMSRQTLQALSAVPRPRMIQADQWVQRRKSDVPRGAHDYSNYQHWLIQEAEQRRITEKNQRSPGARKPHVTGTSVLPYQPMPPKTDNKPLPDSIIQTLTQRVQNRVQDKPLSPRRRLEHSTSQEHLHASQHYQMQPHKMHQPPSNNNGVSNNNNNSESQEKMLSVSGKKKCSHCGDELGRGAAMIIESLRLFYHMECFKCCVCHVRLGDGLMGTDVRVRNHKLHCHNCYSSDDGVKFSCV